MVKSPLSIRWGAKYYVSLISHACLMTMTSTANLMFNPRYTHSSINHKFDTNPKDNSLLGRLERITKPRCIFILGGPGAGKGTQCEMLSHELSIDHLSAGELLRREQETGSPEGKIIAKIIKEGSIVPAAITVSLLKKEIYARGSGRYLIDGFPRNFDNVQEWQKIIKNDIVSEKVLCIDAPTNILLDRLLKRGQSSSNPRSDDNKVSALKRFKTYEKDTKAVVDTFEKQGLVSRINGDNDSIYVFKDVYSIVSNLVKEEILEKTKFVIDCIDRNEWGKCELLFDNDFFSDYKSMSNLDEVDNTSKYNVNSEIFDPEIKLLAKGKVAIISYGRKMKSKSDNSSDEKVYIFNETRVWHIKNGKWLQIHFHGSPPHELLQ